MTVEDHDSKTVEPFDGPLAPAPEPFDVAVVDGPPHPLRRWTPLVAVASSPEPTRVVGANPERSSLTLVNNGTQTGFLVPDRYGNAATGFPIPPGATVNMEHQEAVFVVFPNATAALPQTLNGWAEIDA